MPPTSWIDQPTTQAGNIRTRVYVACKNCRTRKIKCDGLKPICTSCTKKEYAPGPEYQHLLPSNEHYKLQNGICLYDPLPKRRGPDRLPGARVRRKSRQDDSGYERGSRQRIPGDSSEVHQRQRSQERTDSIINVAIDPEMTHLGSRVGGMTSGIDTFIRSSEPPRPCGSTSTLDPIRTALATSTSYSDASQRYLSNRDLSRISPPNSASSSDSAPSPIGLFPPKQDRVISTSDAAIPTDYRSMHSTSKHFVPQVSRTARGRQENPGYIRSVVPHDNQTGSSSSYPVSYEYVPSAGAYIQSLDENEPDEQTRKPPDETVLSLPKVPGAEYVQKTWFDSLLDIYASFETPVDSQVYSVNNNSSNLSFTSEQRRRAQDIMVTDLRQLFARSSYWVSFVHVPTFWSRFYSPEHRSSGEMQPGLVLSALSFASFMRSSEIEGGVWGRERSTRLRAEAEAAVDSSLAVGWIDIGLAQAAWFLTMYEICPHPYHTLQKVHSALVRLDSILRFLGLSTIDAGNPKVTFFDRTANPMVTHLDRRTVEHYKNATNYPNLPGTEGACIVYPPPVNALSGVTINTHPISTQHQATIASVSSPTETVTVPLSYPAIKGCVCNQFVLGRSEVDWKKHTPLWHYTPRWPDQDNAGEMHREEARRIVWATIQLMSSFSGHTATLGTDRHLDEYWVTCAENLLVLSPGESALPDQLLHPNPMYDTKNTVWAIYARAQLLWLACLRVRNAHSSVVADPATTLRKGDVGLYEDPIRQQSPTGHTDAELASFAMRAWLQTQEMEEALNRHTCDLERAFIFQGREYLSSIRMVITQDFSRYVPYPNSGTSSRFNRLQADEWLQHQSAVVQRMMSGLKNVTGMKLSLLVYRPFFVWWFMIQVVRLLNLWSCDKSMVEAIRLSFSFLPGIDYLTAIWPCHNQRNKYMALRERLDSACRQCGLPLPPPPNLNIDVRYSPKELV